MKNIFGLLLLFSQWKSEFHRWSPGQRATQTHVADPQLTCQQGSQGSQMPGPTSDQEELPSPMTEVC